MQDHFKHCFGFIYLTENKKGEKGTVLLTEALKANTTLTQLFMKCLEERQWTFEIQSVHEKNCFIFITGLKQNTIISPLSLPELVYDVSEFHDEIDNSFKMNQTLNGDNVMSTYEHIKTRSRTTLLEQKDGNRVSLDMGQRAAVRFSWNARGLPAFCKQFLQRQSVH